MSTEEQFEGQQGVDTITQFYEKNKNNLMIAGIALILIAGGIYYYNNVLKPQQEEEAAESLFMAERYFSQDSMNKALNGDGINLGLLDVADEYSGTKAGNQASYYAGRALLSQGKYEEALDHLEYADMSDEFMAAQIIALRGDCYSELEQYEEAGDAYMKAANERENSLTTPYALQKAALAYEAAEEYGDALDALQRIKEDYSDSRYVEKLDARIGRVMAKKAAAK
jgi:predicted negative regulator of RcsB-dependent stress response